MTIQAYTFEAKNKSEQLAPHSAKVDARVRRDLFYGAGDLIINGNRDGQLNKEGTIVSGSINTSFTFEISESVTFMAGGRLFTMTGETLTVPVRLINGVSVGSIYFDIDTNEPAGNYVKLVNAPSFRLGDWEADKFSSKYDLVFIRESGKILPFVDIRQNASFAAGETIDLSNFGKKMDGSSAPWRGQISTRIDNVRLTKRGDFFTLVGAIATLAQSYGTAGAVELEAGPSKINVTKTGTAFLMAENWAATADVSTGENGKLLKLTNIKQTTDGTPGTTLYNVNIIANFQGELVYR